jgi:predicted TPR repeat methyltransferase
MAYDENSMVDQYDQEASAVGWLGPEVAFGLAYKYVTPGQTILDIGIGTGLAGMLFHKAGLRVLGMDVSPEMLAACRSKGFPAGLKQHDLRTTPYPYEEGSIDHAVCVGVLNFFEDLNPVFEEAGRILRNGGVFVFVVGDRSPSEEAEMTVDSEHTGSGAPVTMYRHSAEQISMWLADSGFRPLQSLEFAVYMDRGRSARLPARAYLAQKSRGA